MEWKNIFMHLYRHTWILLPVSQPDRTEIRQGMSLQSSVTWGTKVKPLSFCYTPLCWLHYWQTFGGEVWTLGGTHYLFLHRTQRPVASSLLQQGWRDEKKPWLCLQKQRNKKRDNSGEEGTDSSQLCRLYTGWITILPKLIHPASEHCSSARNSTAQTSFYSFQARADTPICTSWASKGWFCYHNLIRIHLVDVTYYSGKCWIVLLPERAHFKKSSMQSKYMTA